MSGISAVAIVVADAAHQVISGVVGKLQTKGGDELLVIITNNDGYDRFDRVPTPFVGELKLTNGVDYYVQPITIPDLAVNVTIRVGLTADPAQLHDIILPPAIRSFNAAPISKEQLRSMALRGNVGGMVLPGLGLSTHDMLFDPMIPWYPDAVQNAIFDVKREAGLNVVQLCSWSDYHGSEFGMPVRYDWINAPDGASQARAYCIKLRRRGFVPFFWLIGDRVLGDQYDASGAHCENALFIIQTILPAIKDVVGAVSPGYELRGCCGADGAPYSAAQYWRMLILMNEIAPEVYKFGHFCAENSAGSSHSPGEPQDPWHEDEIGFWINTNWPQGSTLLDGCFYQAPTGGKLFEGNEWEDRWQEMIERIGAGNRRWPALCTDVDLVWGEAGWYDVTRGSVSQANVERVAARALAMGGKWSFSG